MKYQSKKDESVYAELIEVDDKYGTTMLKYITGEKVGKTISVTGPTLKRWWRKVADDIAVNTNEVETESQTTESQDVLSVSVVDEETGKTTEVEIDTNAFIPGVDDVKKEYDFNNQPKKHIPMPKAVAEIYQLGEDPYPTVDELVDMLVEWGASVKKYAEWIRLTDGTRIIFRYNKRVPSNASIEVRMAEEVLISGYETVYKPSKSALIKSTPYTINVKTVADLETVVKSLLATTK